MPEIVEIKKLNDNVKIDPSIDKKYKGKVLFPEKLEKAIKHFEGRDINSEIEQAFKKGNHKP